MKRWMIIFVLTGAVVAVSAGCGNKETESEKLTEAVTEKATEVVSEIGTEAVTEKGIEKTAGEIDLEAMGAAGPFGVFETFTLEGEKATQEIFTEADLTMVNIWGTFCSPCINEMPDLGELAKDYKEKGIQMLGIISDVTEVNEETASLIVEETKAEYTHLILSESLYASVSQIQSVPTTVFIDSTGKQVGYTYPGARSKEEWSGIMDEMLQEVQTEQ